MKNYLVYCAVVMAMCLSALHVSAQQTYRELEQLTVNENVTTVITASEPIRLVDISTEHVAGDKPIENTVRLKPTNGEHQDGDILAIVTIVTERYRTQYALIYTTMSEEAVTDKEIAVDERTSYTNPAVSMSAEEMIKYARRIWNSPARFKNVKTRKNRMTMRLNNIYTVGEYFFLDFSVENRTNIMFNIDELRFKLDDKKQSKSTTVQSIDLTPVLLLDNSKVFHHGYRQVAVIKKMTFPNDKVLSITLSERQISGRNITMSLDYEDVLAADGFNTILLNEE